MRAEKQKSRKIEKQESIEPGTPKLSQTCRAKKNAKINSPPNNNINSDNKIQESLLITCHRCIYI